MIVDRPGRVCRFADVPRGGAFRFNRDGRTMLAIKAWSASGREADSCLVIAPGHPDFGIAPGLYDGSLLEDGPVLSLDDVHLVPEFHKTAYRFGDDPIPDGALLLDSDRVLLTVPTTTASKPLLVELGSGEIVERRPSAPIACVRWSLVYRGPGGPVTFFTFGEQI